MLFSSVPNDSIKIQIDTQAAFKLASVENAPHLGHPAAQVTACVAICYNVNVHVW